MTDPDHSDTPDTGAEARTLEFEIEVAGSPEEVWAAIATGPGVSSWYVPHTIEERAGGAASARFGPGEEMEVPGQVIDWDPPKRILLGGDGPDEGMAFEWTVEARSGDTCTVRLVNSGFGSGEHWDAMYDGLRDGWPMFLLNLQLHCEHFRGQHATAMLPTASWTGSKADRWPVLLDAVGLSAPVETGARIELGGDDDGPPPLAGTVVDVAEHRIAILLDGPAPGTAFVAAE
ncbi:MAG: SRPBCC domain-containing protein, partial [Actinomycetota bacterium]